MDIKYISIEGLFGQFNHKVNLSNNVNIIIGDNGVGKTVTLKILESLFSNRLAYLFEVDFSRIVISFGKEIWQITPTLSATKNRSNVDAITIKSNIHDEHRVLLEETTIDIPPYIYKISDNEWYDSRRGFVFSEKELMVRYGLKTISDTTKNLPLWYINRTQKNRVRLIDTQRIYHQEMNRRYPELGRMVDKFSKDIVKIVGEYKIKADKIENDLEKTFPNRLIQRLSSSNNEVPIATISDKLKELISLQAELQQVGLGDYRQDSLLKEIDKVNSPVLQALSLYVEDSLKKIHCYEEIIPPLKLFLGIINSRFQYKKCKLDPMNGFVVYHDKKTIPLSRLSSGEQNEFVLFYDLLFNCGSTDLILIDEPELSLHVKWQQMMINDLMSICEHNNLSVLIATHSPDLIGNHWSIVQKLK